MRRLLIGLVVTATTALVPLLAFAGNQETAERIAASLRSSGQLHGYKIGVKFQDGTAWLRGRVTDQEQMQTALRLAARTPGVDRVENELSIVPAEPTTPSAPDSTLIKLQNALSQTLSRRQASNQVRPASADTPARPLEQVTGAVAPEQFPRAMSTGLETGRSRPVAQTRPNGLTAAATAPLNRGQPLPTSFTPMPAQPTIATSPGEPTLAPPQEPAWPTLAPPAPERTVSQRIAALEVPARPVVQEAVPQPVFARQVVPQPVFARQVVPQQAVARQVVPQQVMPQQMPVQAAMPAAAPRPIPVAYAQAGGPVPMGQGGNAALAPGYVTPVSGGVAPARYDQPHVPNYAWPSYAPYPNYAALTYPKQYSPTAWPYIGPFYPYPQVPLGWRKVTLEWHDGWWMLDFDDGATAQPLSGLFRCK